MEGAGWKHWGMDVLCALILLGNIAVCWRTDRVTFWMLGLCFTPSGQIFAGSEAWIRPVKADSASELTYNRVLRRDVAVPFLKPSSSFINGMMLSVLIFISISHKPQTIMTWLMRSS